MIKLKYSKTARIIFLIMPNLTISFTVMLDIKEISKIVSIEEGFFTVETDYGEEYIDFIELVECSKIFSEAEKEKMISNIQNIDINDVDLEVV